jgi:hypothetical protein
MDRFRYRWRSRPDAAALERNVDELRTAIIALRRELENKQDANGRLKLLLRERLARIDELTSQIDQLRHQKLDQECEHLAEMVQQLPLEG